jgi:hypothetical protein
MLRTGLNCISLLGPHIATGNALHDLILRHNCNCTWWRTAGSVAPAPDSAPPAVVLLDPDGDATACLAALRALPGLWGNAPVLGVGPLRDAGAPPVAGWIELPLDEAAAIAAIEEWTGPLADRAWRDPDDPGYRLVRLVGMTRATAMLGRLAVQLAEALTRLAEPGDPAVLRGLAHRVAGIAGLYGFADLGEAWLKVERGESGAEAVAAEAARVALAVIRRWPER